MADKIACPFCSGEAEVKRSLNFATGSFVQCRNCGGKGPDLESEPEALAAWLSTCISKPQAETDATLLGRLGGLVQAEFENRGEQNFSILVELISCPSDPHSYGLHYPDGGKPASIRGNISAARQVTQLSTLAEQHVRDLDRQLKQISSGKAWLP